MNERPLTPAAAASTLWQIEQDIDTETNALVVLRKQYAQLLKTHRLEYAKAFLGATGTVEDRKRIAERDTIECWFAVQTHEQEVAVCQDKLRSLRERSEIGRAINSNLKEEMRFTASVPGRAA